MLLGVSVPATVSGTEIGRTEPLLVSTIEIDVSVRASARSGIGVAQAAFGR